MWQKQISPKTETIMKDNTTITLIWLVLKMCNKLLFTLLYQMWWDPKQSKLSKTNEQYN